MKTTNDNRVGKQVKLELIGGGSVTGKITNIHWEKAGEQRLFRVWVDGKAFAGKKINKFILE